LLRRRAPQALDAFHAAIDAAILLGGAVAVHCDGRAGAALVLLTAALLRDGLFPSAAAAAAWLRLLRPDPAAAAAAATAARALAHDGGGGFDLASRATTLSAPASTADSNDGGRCTPEAAAAAAAVDSVASARAGVRRQRASMSFCIRSASPSKSASPVRDGRRHSVPCISAVGIGGDGDGGDGGGGGTVEAERLVFRRTPSGGRARLCSAYGDGGRAVDSDRRPFGASSPELLPVHSDWP
jgi:hypothetical protein